MYWYWFSSFIYVYINFQPCLGSAACAGKGYGPCTTTVFCCRCDRHPKAGSKHRGPKWHFSAQISKASTGCGRQNADVWLRNFCLLHILRGTYTNFITSDRLWKLPILRCHTPKFGFGPLFCFGPTFLFVGKTPCCIIYALNGVIWWNRGRWEAVKCISTQHLCPGCMKSLPSSKLLQASIFWMQCPHTLKAPTNAPSPAPFSFLDILQAETDGNLKLLVSAPGSCWHLWLLTRQLHSAKQLHVSWYEILEQASKYKWGFFAAGWRGSARHSTCGVNFIRLHSNKKK